MQRRNGQEAASESLGRGRERGGAETAASEAAGKTESAREYSATISHREEVAAVAALAPRLACLPCCFSCCCWRWWTNCRRGDEWSKWCILRRYSATKIARRRQKLPQGRRSSGHDGGCRNEQQSAAAVTDQVNSQWSQIWIEVVEHTAIERERERVKTAATPLPPSTKSTPSLSSWSCRRQSYRRYLSFVYRLQLTTERHLLSPSTPPSPAAALLCSFSSCSC